MSWTGGISGASNAKLLAGETSIYTTAVSNASQVALELNVTAAPRLETSVRVLIKRSLDGTNWSEPLPATSFVGVKNTGRYIATIDVKAPYERYAVMPLNVGLTASVNAVSR